MFGGGGKRWWSVDCSVAGKVGEYLRVLYCTVNNK